MVPFPLPLLEAKTDFFLYSLWEPNRIPGSKTDRYVKGPQWLSPPGVFISQTCHTIPPAILQVKFNFPYSGTDSHRDFCPRSFALVSCDLLYLSVSLSNFGGCSMPSDLTSLMDLRRVIEFTNGISSNRFISKTYKELIQLNIKKTNNLIKI